MEIIQKAETMTQSEKTDYLTLKRSVYRESSSSYDEDRDRFVSGTALAQRIERSLLGMPGFVEKKTEFHLSTAAANVAKETVRFTLFADILRDIESEGLDPYQVQQGVVFFTGKRGLGQRAPAAR